MKPIILMAITVLGTRAATVPICLSQKVAIDNFAILRAQTIVTRVFADAGVRVAWLPARQCESAPEGTLHLILDAKVPSTFGPTSLGYAHPFGAGGEIHIFYSRIREEHRSDFAIVLGHAMAHEIAHVLQGLARHSGDGIMKARWTPSEYYEMQCGRLRFAREDVEFIQRGMERPAPALLAARF